MNNVMCIFMLTVRDMANKILGKQKKRVNKNNCYTRDKRQQIFVMKFNIFIMCLIAFITFENESMSFVCNIYKIKSKLEVCIQLIITSIQ